MPNRTLLIAGNWKMNNDVAEAAKLADELAQALPEVPAGVEVLVCPPTIDITTLMTAFRLPPSPSVHRTCTGRPRVPSPVSPLATCSNPLAAPTASSVTPSVVTTSTRPTTKEQEGQGSRCRRSCSCLLLRRVS